MATKKTTKKPIKKTNKKKQPACAGRPADKIAAEIKKVTDELVTMAMHAKKHYDKVDDKTKKQVVAGVAGAAALIATAIGISKMRKK
jgi:hypothetical protein